MVKALSPTDVNVQSTQQLVDAIGFNFSKMAALAKQPEMQALLDESWQYIQQLERVNRAIEAGAQAALKEMARQRDEAINHIKYPGESVVRAAKLERQLEHAADEWAKSILAGQIAYDGYISKKDVLLVLEVLAGERDTLAEPELEELYGAIEKLGNRVIEEQLAEVFDAASREEESETED